MALWNLIDMKDLAWICVKAKGLATLFWDVSWILWEFVKPHQPLAFSTELSWVDLNNANWCYSCSWVASFITPNLDILWVYQFFFFSHGIIFKKNSFSSLKCHFFQEIASLYKIWNSSCDLHRRNAILLLQKPRKHSALRVMSVILSNSTQTRVDLDKESFGLNLLPKVPRVTDIWLEHFSLHDYFDK